MIHVIIGNVYNWVHNSAIKYSILEIIDIVGYILFNSLLHIVQ